MESLETENAFIKKTKKVESRKKTTGNGQLNGDENPFDTLNKLICDHKSLFEQYRSYTKDADKIFGKYMLMVEALKQERDTNKQLLQCESTDPIISKKKRKIRNELMILLNKETCLVESITKTLEQINRVQLGINEKEKDLMIKKVDLSKFFEAAKIRFTRIQYIQDLEHHKYQRSVHYNSSIVENQKLRDKIDDIKVLRNKYEVSYKKVLKEIEMIKLKKKKLLEEAQQSIEEKETTVTMINAVLSGNKKEEDLYQQKIESMKQMIRYDTKATDFLARKLNERSDLRAIGTERQLDELKKTMQSENKMLSQQKEALEAIQDLTEEKEGFMMVHTYNQKEADKMALFNYIADLNGELTHLKQKHNSLLKDIEELKNEEIVVEENYNVLAKKNEEKYLELMREMDKCDKESCQINATMEIIKHFIECTFKELCCDMDAIETKLGLDLDVNPRNMTEFLSEIEVEVARLIHSYNYGMKLRSLSNREHLKDEEGLDVIKRTMRAYESVIPYGNEMENFKNVQVPNAALSTPAKDGWNIIQEKSVSDTNIYLRALTKEEIEETVKKEMVHRNLSINHKLKSNK
ncbi:hypothetical protein HELRODRAFT_163447 [Helobdella robusta]|uniref:ODAD1 central coiled coil region domain-containing protein n=1 Tax=Helobdella robusta TaxID=6412 RepID=T1EU23_HELRO|nr:hypothetical protein HELRODRAFT_163447 [Helobdella robusta]ESN96388.1 hypothetical protein HELRODRAFT_163447 [Helobdella robusta]